MASVIFSNSVVDELSNNDQSKTIALFDLVLLLIEHFFSTTDGFNHDLILNTDRDETGDIGHNDDEDNQSITYRTF